MTISLQRGQRTRWPRTFSGAANACEQRGHLIGTFIEVQVYALTLEDVYGIRAK